MRRWVVVDVVPDRDSVGFRFWSSVRKKDISARRLRKTFGALFAERVGESGGDPLPVCFETFSSQTSGVPVRLLEEGTIEKNKN